MIISILASRRSAATRVLGVVQGVALLALLVMSLGRPEPAGADEPRPFPRFYKTATIFDRAIAAERTHPPIKMRVTGLTVPHHLLAADLMARGFRALEGQSYDRIILLGPDHFRKLRAPFATTRRGFRTALGPVETDQAAASALLAPALGSLVEESELFETEHAFRALLPFVRHTFPGVPVVALAFARHAFHRHWDALLPTLEGLTTSGTLILQSTDYSHFLKPHEAAVRDQETLNLIAAGDADAITRLHQPFHLDSVPGEYLQTRLQQRRFAAQPVVIANANSAIYSKRAAVSTTSYIVKIYSPHAATQTLPRAWPASQLFYVAGDTLLGRFMADKLADPAARARLADRINRITANKPLILNLEGVMLDDVPERLKTAGMTMQTDLSLDLMKRINVVAASLANNHTNDFGADALDVMKTRLAEAGIQPLLQGGIADLGPFRIVAMTDLSNTIAPHRGLITPALLDEIDRRPAAPPLIAMLHWGREFVIEPAPRERELADALRQRAIPLIIGTHPHARSDTISALAGGATSVIHSTGNFIFDQLSQRSSGAIVELRVFDQGTVFARQIPIPNFYRALTTQQRAGTGARSTRPSSISAD